jgi:hypothetical protein
MNRSALANDTSGPAAAEWVMPGRERTILLAILGLAALTFTCGLTVADPDLWGHTLYGLRAIDQGVPAEAADPFSYTASGRPWINHEWLTEWTFGWLWRILGDFGLWLWRGAMAVALFAATLAAIRRWSASIPAAAVVLGFGTLCLSDFFVFVRPQLATLALFAVTLHLLSSHWTTPRVHLLLPLPLLMVAWTNLHGGFLAGLAIVVLFALAGIVRAVRDPSWRLAAMQLAATAIGCGLATLVNPYGPRLHAMLWEHLVPDQAVAEWQPLLSGRQSPTYYVPILLTLPVLTFSRRWRWIDLVVLAATAFQAMSHVRHVALWCVAAMILLPGPLSDVLSRTFHRMARQWSGRSRGGLRLAGAAAFAAGLAALHFHHAGPIYSSGLAPWQIAVEVTRDVPGIPLGAMEFCKRERIEGNLVTDYAWGQYVLWCLYPECRVAFDGRYRTIYPMDLEREFLAFSAAGEVSSAATVILDRYPTEIVLVPATRGPSRLMTVLPDWALVYDDGQAHVFLRRIPRFDQVIGRCSHDPTSPPAQQAWRRFPASPVRELPTLARHGAIADPR